MPVSSCQCRVSCTIARPAASRAACRVISYRTARSTLRSELTFFVSVRVPSGTARCSGEPGAVAGHPRAQRHVGVAAQRALLHPHVADAQRAQQVAQRGDVGPGDLRRPLPRPLDRLGDDLDQRDARPVVVDERVVGAVDPPGGAADVQRLAGVLLHVGALDLDPEGACRRRARRRGSRRRRSARRTARSGSSSACPGRSSSSARTGTSAAIAQFSARPIRIADSSPRALSTGSAPGRPEADRAHLAVRLGAERRRAAAEHLGRRVELDVHLEPEHRVEGRHASS